MPKIADMPAFDNFIRTEGDVEIKIALPLIHALGYEDKQIFKNPPMLDVPVGRQKKTVRADFVIKINETSCLVLEAKKEEESLDEALEQGKSYAQNITKNPDFVNVEYIPFVLAIDVNELWLIESKSQVAWKEALKYRTNDLVTINKVLDNSEAFKKLSSTVSQENVLLWLKKTGKLPVQEEEITLEPVTEDNWQQIRKIFEKCHDLIRNRYADHPTQAFHEISKILFIKMNEEHLMKKFKGKKNRFTVKAIVASKKSFNQNLIDQMFEEVKQAYISEKLFEPQDKIKLSFPHILRIVKWLQVYRFVDDSIGSDIAGKVFETFVGSTLRGKGLGQFFTPRPIVELMVAVVNPKIGNKILDPACGSGGFLITSFIHTKCLIKNSGLDGPKQKELLHKLVNEDLCGIDLNEAIGRTCKMNMIVHGDGRSSVYAGKEGLIDIRADNALDVKTFSDQLIKKEVKEYDPKTEEGGFDVILTNPPFGGILEKGEEEEYEFLEDESFKQEGFAKEITDPEILKNFKVGRGKDRVITEKLFVERCLQLLKPSGKLGIVVPDGILNDQSNQDIRNVIKEEAIIDAIISLPEITFKPSGTGVRANCLFLHKKAMKKEGKDPEKQGDVFMAIAEHVGYTGVKRIKPDSNDLKQVIFPEWVTFIQNKK
jgi:type I restriction-modification system DNA methylase subunit